MAILRFLALTSLLILPILFAGCNQNVSEEASLLGDNLFPLADELENNGTTATPAAAHLELKLKPGDRFPLIKIVERELTQSALGKKPDKSTSRLELVMAITVEEINANQKKLGVQYTRVKYSHKLPNETINYDSNNPPLSIPKVVRPYHGLVNNGFSFWIGADNQIIDLVGFPNFLQKCLKEIPEQEREQVMTLLTRSSGKDGVVNFIDDSIGLLPYDLNHPENATLVSVGSTWNRKHETTQPASMTINKTYTLRDLNHETAKIDVVGTIVPSVAFGNGNTTSVQLQIKNGNTFGACTIDVRTGLPIESRTEQFLDMSVTLGAGIQFDQQSRVVTTVRAFPHQQSPPDKVARSPYGNHRTLAN